MIRITRAGVALTVGIIVLTALLVGGLFWVKNTGETARREEAIKIAEQNLEDQSDEGVALNDGQGESSEQSATNNGSTSGSGAGSETIPSTGATVSELPETGPSGSLSFLIIVAALTYFGVLRYRSSREALEA